MERPPIACDLVRHGDARDGGPPDVVVGDQEAAWRPGLSTPIWCRTRVRSGVVAGSISQMSSNGAARPCDRSADGPWRSGCDPAGSGLPLASTYEARPPRRLVEATASGWRSPVAEAQRPSRPEVARRVLERGHEGPADAPAPPAGSTQRRRTSPTPAADGGAPRPRRPGGPAASPQRATRKTPSGRLEHGRRRGPARRRRGRRSARRARPRPAPPPSGARRRRRALGQRDARRQAEGTDPYPLSFPTWPGHPVPGRTTTFLPCSHPSPPTSTSSPSSRPSWPAGRRTASSSAPIEQREGAAALGLLRGPADGQRHAGPAPRLGPGLQGPLLPLPHHGRVVRGPPRRLGHPRAPGRGRGREEARHHRASSRSRTQVGIAEFTRLCRESVYSYVDEFARLTTRIGYWVDMDAAYWTLEPRLHRVGLVAPAAALRPGAALRGPQGRAVLPALRHGAVEPRAGPARRLPRRGGRVGLRPAAPGRPGPGAWSATPSGWPCGRPRRGRCCRTPAWR